MPELESGDLWEAATVEDAVRHLTTGRLWSCNLLGSERAQRIMTAVLSEIPHAISGGVGLADPVMKIGGCDFWDIPTDSPTEEGVLYGHSKCAVVLVGNGAPLNWKAYDEMFFEVSEVRSLQADVERIIGPVKRCIIWSV